MLSSVHRPRSSTLPSISTPDAFSLQIYAGTIRNTLPSTIFFTGLCKELGTRILEPRYVLPFARSGLLSFCLRLSSHPIPYLPDPASSAVGRVTRFFGSVPLPTCTSFRPFLSLRCSSTFPPSLSCVFHSADRKSLARAAPFTSVYLTRVLPRYFRGHSHSHTRTRTQPPSS
ncbi:hypothetical protein EXIGLDRAFT_420362 [Exidia glandulosa HHB12029]|uniref:Uncharacterized protein n=1 Tax=Exidia glandulosa HHB12029 TaxID=1314781 RepID=A0A165KLI5_EXIGL|nr:hypothetical protein EXIGLDRAFT_420362 [Exidia glandulosa HHB12029]